MNRLGSLGASIRKVADLLASFMIYYTFLCGILMMLLIVADITGRYFWTPIPGTHSIVSYWFMVAFVFLTIACVERDREHIEATFIRDRLPKRIAALASIFGIILMLTVFIIMGWVTLERALQSMAIGEFREEVYNLIIWPSTFYLPIGCWGLSLQLFVHLYDDCAAFVRNR
ncbi:TRAP transporter small permease subunit [Chloroflexota bacterium]